MKFLKIHHPVESNNPNLIQEYYRERFYGGITLIAVNITILSSEVLVSPVRAFFIIIFTTLGLWGASILASVLSHRVAHTSLKKQEKEIKNSFFTHKAIIISSIPSLVFITCSIISLIDLKTALLCAISLSVIRFGVTMYDAFSKNNRSTLLNFFSIFLQIFSVGVIIILKILSEK